MKVKVDVVGWKVEALPKCNRIFRLPSLLQLGFDDWKDVGNKWIEHLALSKSQKASSNEIICLPFDFGFQPFPIPSPVLKISVSEFVLFVGCKCRRLEPIISPFNPEFEDSGCTAFAEISRGSICFCCLPSTSRINR